MYTGCMVNTESYRPVVDIVISPNGITHKYIVPDYQSLTDTPHIELFGYDVTRIGNRGALPMNESTRELYDAVKAVSARFESVSIQPDMLSIAGPQKYVEGFYNGDWPKDLSLDLEVVACLRRHVGWSTNLAIRVRKQTLAEAEMVMEETIREAVRKGLISPDRIPQYGHHL